MRGYFCILLVLSVCLSVFSASQAAAVETRFTSIGTGGVKGVYYPAGNAICRLVNKTRIEHGIRCAVESTAGSIYNLDTIAADEFDMGIVQSDTQYHAYRGTDEFSSQGANQKLRAIFSLHSEPFTVVARADAGIEHLADLQGKRVNIGNPGSGQRATMDVVMAALNWTTADFELASELKSTEQSQALCLNEVDAMVFTVGHPSSSVKEASTSCGTVLVKVTGPAIDKLVADNAYYRFATISGGLYRGTDSDIKTFGVSATLVTSTKVDAEIIYQVVKAVFENFENFKKLHPAFVNLNKEEMIKEGLSAPLHKGAIRYYKEAGLM